MTASKSYGPSWNCDIPRGEGELREKLLGGVGEHLEKVKKGHKCGRVVSGFSSGAKAPPEKSRWTEAQIKDYGSELWD